MKNNLILLLLFIVLINNVYSYEIIDVSPVAFYPSDVGISKLYSFTISVYSPYPYLNVVQPYVGPNPCNITTFPTEYPNITIHCNAYYTFPLYEQVDGVEVRLLNRTNGLTFDSRFFEFYLQVEATPPADQITVDSYSPHAIYPSEVFELILNGNNLNLISEVNIMNGYCEIIEVTSQYLSCLTVAPDAPIYIQNLEILSTTGTVSVPINMTIQCRDCSGICNPYGNCVPYTSSSESSSNESSSSGSSNESSSNESSSSESSSSSSDNSITCTKTNNSIRINNNGGTDVEIVCIASGNSICYNDYFKCKSNYNYYDSTVECSTYNNIICSTDNTISCTASDFTCEIN